MNYIVALSDMYVEADSEQLAVDKAQRLIDITMGRCVNVEEAFDEYVDEETEKEALDGKIDAHLAEHYWWISEENKEKYEKHINNMAC